MSDTDSIPRLLRDSKTIAVVGLSSNPQRASNGVSRYLKRSGYTVIPVNPNETEVLGEKAYPSLLDVPVPVDIVNVFRRREYVPAVVDDAIRIRAKAVWMQLGIFHAEAAAKARAEGLLAIEDKCIMIERMALGF